MKYRLGGSAGNQHGVICAALFSILLASTTLLFATGAAALTLTPEPPETLIIGQPAADPGDAVDGFLAIKARFDAFGGEDYKNALIADAQRQKARYEAQLAGATPPEGMPQWRSLGPTGAKYESTGPDPGITLKVSDSGRTRRVLQDPSDPDTVYVLTAGGGLWKTTTFTHTNPTWAPLTDSLFSTSGGDVAFGRNANTIYLGLGDPFISALFPSLSGVMVKSTDGGGTWSSFQTLAGSSTVRDVAVDTSTSNDIVLVAADQGLYRSTDAGQTYTLVLAAVPEDSAIFGGFWSLARTSAGWLATDEAGTVYRSIDRGATWTKAAKFAGAARMTLGVGAPGDAVVYAFAASVFCGNTCGGDTFDLLRSSDGGLSWRRLGVNAGGTPQNPNINQPDLNLMGNQGFYNQMVLVDPADATRQTIYLGGQLSTAKSTDGGTSWTIISNWLPGQLPDPFFGNFPGTAGLAYVHADCHTASIITLNNRTGIVFGTDGGLFVSTDGGATFDSSKNDGMVTMLTQTVSGSSKNPQNLITGAQDTGTRARLGASSVFNQVLYGDGQGVGWSQANNHATVATIEGGIISVNPGLLPNTKGDWMFGLLFRRRPGDTRLFYTAIATPSGVTDPSGTLFFTTSQKRVFAFAVGDFSAPAGPISSFTCAQPGQLPSDFNIRDGWHMLGLDAADPNFNRLAVGASGGRIGITRDGCPTWTVVNLINAVPGFQGFISSPAWTTKGELYVASESPLTGSVRVVKILANGLAWARADFGLPDSPVYHIVADLTDASANTLYAGTGIGVYRTTDGGASWSRFGAGLPAIQSTGLWLAEDNSVLRVATYGRGIWEINP